VLSPIKLGKIGGQCSAYVRRTTEPKG